MPFDGSKTTEKLDILMELVSKSQDISQWSFCHCLWHECIEHPRLAELGLADLGENMLVDARGGRAWANVPVRCGPIADFFLRGTPFANTDRSRFACMMFGAYRKQHKHQYLKDLMEGDHAF